jgi:hypothetical protein
MEDALKRERIAAAITSLAFSGILSSAWADDQSVPKPSEPKDDLAEVVVTGSRIRRPELDRLQPTTVQNSEYVERGGYTNVIDVLNQLPAFAEPDSSLMGGPSIFGVGQSFAAFLGLGSQRILILVDGRRFVPANAPTIFGGTGTPPAFADLVDSRARSALGGPAKRRTFSRHSGIRAQPGSAAAGDSRADAQAGGSAVSITGQSCARGGQDRVSTASNREIVAGFVR